MILGNIIIRIFFIHSEIVANIKNHRKLFLIALILFIKVNLSWKALPKLTVNYISKTLMN